MSQGILAPAKGLVQRIETNLICVSYTQYRLSDSV